MSGQERDNHLPVLTQATIRELGVAPGKDYIDGTVGGAGHAKAILDASSPDGRLLGLDADPHAIARCERRLARYGARVTLVGTNFAELGTVARASGFGQVHGVLLDLGLSSFQLAAPEAGFSFQHDGPLDMRFDPRQSRTAADLVNGLSESELADLLWRYGEERQSRRIAREIVARRPLRTTSELAAAVASIVGRTGRLHPATRSFMALRIATNDELAVLESVLPQAVQLLIPGQGRLAVLSYHSLEDRIVKRWLQQESRDCLCPPKIPVCVCQHMASVRRLTRKPIRPSSEEMASNPRSRSARLRLAERLATS